MTFLWFFRKIFNKFGLFFVFKIWNSQPCSLVLIEYSQSLRILPPNLTGEIFIVFEIWRFLWFFQKSQKKINEFFFFKFKVPNPVVGCYQSTLRGCKPCLQLWLLISFQFSRYDVFCAFFKKKFQKNEFIFVFKIWNPFPCSCCCQGYSRSCESCLQLWLLKSL